MTAGDAFGLLLTVGLIAFILRTWVWPKTVPEKQIDRGQSIQLDVAQTGSKWVPQFDPLIRAGSKIFVPAGDGLYVTRVNDRSGENLKNTMKKWVIDKKAEVNLMITAPTEQSYIQWQWLVDECPERFHVFVLHRERVVGPGAERLKEQIASLDTYHAVILLGKLNAMWIEPYHPIGSKYAYHVEFVAPVDAVKDKRLGQYRDLYKRLLKGRHVEEIKPSSQQKQRSMAA